MSPSAPAREENCISLVRNKFALSEYVISNERCVGARSCCIRKTGRYDRELERSFVVKRHIAMLIHLTVAPTGRVDVTSVPVV